MTKRPLLLHVNDVDLTLYAAADQRASSPGIAHMGKHGLKLGHEAKDLARRFPKSHHNHFWHSLRQEPLSGEDRVERTEAELVFEHLQKLVADLQPSHSEVVVAVAGTHDREALSLLLGIVDACGLKPVGLVHAGLLQSVHRTPSDATHVELHLGHAVITDMTSSEDGHHAAGETRSIEGLGIDHAMKHWIEGLAKEFILQTRYDPLHSPEGEQQLYDLLWQNLKNDHPQTLELSSKSKPYTIDLDPKTWAEASTPFITALKEALPKDQTLILSPHAASLPSVSPALKEGSDVHTVDDDAIWTNYARCWPTIAKGRDKLVLIRELPQQHAEDQLANPTHIVVGAKAWPLAHPLFITNNDGRLTLERTANESACVFKEGPRLFIDAHGQNIRVNGKAIASPKLLAGDIITLEGVEGHAMLVSEVVDGS